MRSILILFLIVPIFLAPSDEWVNPVPGYPEDYPTKIYSGYLSTASENRSLHYVFVESAEGAKPEQPVTLWLNGGPGCSSMLGFLQEIGPYYLQDGIDYKVGDKLTQNKYSWHKYSHLLFIQSPAGVGFSYNLETNFTFTNQVVASDTFAALQNFFTKFPEYKQSKFWIAGQSYAGIYIPDLAVKIDNYNNNASNPINFKGILIGNGAMDFTDDSLEISTIDFYAKRQFVDPDLIHYWTHSCKNDEASAGCQYFLKRFEDNTQQINPYSVYDYCYYNSTSSNGKLFQTQESTLRKALDKMKGKKPAKLYGGAPCLYFNGVYDYFNYHGANYKSKWPTMTWNGPCAENVSDNYKVLDSGSMISYKHLLGKADIYQIVLYNGNWDAAVPYVDTLKNLQKLGLSHSNKYQPWFINDNQDHVGFIQLWQKITFMLFKGASHMVPQTKRQASQQMFRDVISSHNGTQTFLKLTQ